MRTDILGHPPSLCNCRRVWHPCHTHAPYQGVQLSQLHQPSSHCIFPQNSQNFLAEENFCVFCVFRRTILRNLNICAFCAFRGRIRSRQVAWVWQGCHTLLSVFCGQYISARLVQQRLLHPLRELLCIPWENTTHPNLLCIPCIPWEDTAHPNLPCVCSVGGHALLVYSFLVYLKINDYGYAPGWRLQPKPIVLARHPSSRRDRPASHP